MVLIYSTTERYSEIWYYMHVSFFISLAKWFSVWAKITDRISINMMIWICTWNRTVTFCFVSPILFIPSGHHISFISNSLLRYNLEFIETWRRKERRKEKEEGRKKKRNKRKGEGGREEESWIWQDLKVGGRVEKLYSGQKGQTSGIPPWRLLAWANCKQAN